MTDRKWSSFWFLFFSVCLSTFAVLLMLQLTKAIHISWWWIVTPVIVMNGFPMLLLAVSALIEYMDGDEVDDD